MSSDEGYHGELKQYDVTESRLGHRGTGGATPWELVTGQTSLQKTHSDWNLEAEGLCDTDEAYEM